MSNTSGLQYQISCEIRSVTPAYNFLRCFSVRTNFIRSMNKLIRSLNEPAESLLTTTIILHSILVFKFNKNFILFSCG